jgi:hypothetical protein
MCGELTMLSRLSSERFLARCACGCLHLVWDNATLRLHERDLPLIARSLTGAPSLGGVAVACDPFGQVQVWLRSGGLRLGSADFHAFYTLIQDGATGLGSLAAVSYDHAPGTPLCQTLN